MKLGARFTDDCGSLMCPACGEVCNHHDRVTTYSRPEDGTAEPVVVNVPDNHPEAGDPPRPREIPENPSIRRSGVVIEGYCECCDARWALTVNQRKGATVLSLDTVS